MKKMMRSTFGRLFNKNWVLAAILICGASVFTSCGNVDDPATKSVSKKCTRFSVVYRINSPKANLDFFDGKYAIKNGDEVKEIDKLYSFIPEFGSAYHVTQIAEFPVEQAVCLHYGVKDDLASFEGNYELNREFSLIVTSYNANDDVLDTQTISDEYTESVTGGDETDLAMTEKLSYVELHAIVAEDGMITLSKVNKMHPEKSGIDW